MNEKIRELAEQAGEIEVVNVVDRGDGYMETQVVKEFDKEKFAELIVRECVDICNQAILQNQDTLSKLNVDELAEKMIIHGSINQAQKLGKGIKEHFGVEL
jgi:myo-inositol-hexaphosphate 3-phosphohydrolase